jgi:hypothetical protein
MTPKEKAIEIYNNFLNPSGDTYLYGMLEHESAKECALIAVDEVIEFMEADDFDSDTCYWANHSKMQYWVEVKQEIENL